MKSYVRRFILVLFISTILLIMAIEQPSSVASSSQQASMVEIIGVLNIIQDDRSQYILVDNNGNSYSLDLDENLTKEQGGPLKLDRKEVVVNGILDPLTNTIKVLAIELANEVKLASNTTSSQNITNVNLTIVKVSGILNTIWPVVGPNVTANHTTTPTYYLVDNNGTSFLLDLDENLTKEQGGPLKLDRKEVVVNGILDPLTNTIKVLAIELANEVKLASNTTSSQNITNVNLTIVKVSGILNTIWPVVGPNVTANHTTTPTYYLVDNNGTSFLLDLDENLTKEQGGPLKLDRKEVVVNGILDPLTNTIKVLAIELANEVKLASNTTSSQNITNVNLTIVKVSGILNTIWPVVGPNVTANHTTTPTYYLVDNNGTSFLLDLDENLTKEQGGPLKLDRKEVVVNGILDPLTNTIKILAIELV